MKAFCCLKATDTEAQNTMEPVSRNLKTRPTTIVQDSRSSFDINRVFDFGLTTSDYHP